MADKDVTLTIRRHLVNAASPPKPLHKVVWTRIGTDLVIDVGHFDLQELRTALEKARQDQDPGAVTLHVTDRFMLTPNGATELLQAAQQIVEDLKKIVQPDDGEVH